VVDSDAITLFAPPWPGWFKRQPLQRSQLAAQHRSWNLNNICYSKLFYHGLFQPSFLSVDPKQKTISNGTAINSNRSHPIITTIYTNRPSAAKSTAASAACKYIRFYHQAHH
jgi:hypothetical protein